MNIHGKNHKTHLTPREDHRRRGSVLLLVAAVLILVFVLGLMVMEIARLDRVSTNNLSVAQDMDMVYDMTLSRLRAVLKDDLGIDDNDTPNDLTDDTFFAADTDDDGENEKPFDYPGPLDPWLASTLPEDDGSATPTWGQVSRVTEHFSDNSTTQSGVQARDVTTLSASQDQIFADADGDGIVDSKWAPAPIPVVNGVRYEMAVRLVDSGSLVNLNAATAMTNDGDAMVGTGSNQPRGYWPTNVDLSRLLKRANAPADVWMEELATNASSGTESLFFFRQVSQSLPTAIGLTDVMDPDSGNFAPDSVAEAWYGRFRAWGSSSDKLGIAEELALRTRNGVLPGSTELETRMPELMRDGNEAFRFNSVTNVTTPGDYLLGSNNPIDSRTLWSVRHLLTTRNGAVPFAQRFGNMNNQYRYDLRYEDGGPTDNNLTRVNAIQDRIATILKLGSPKYKNMTDSQIDELAASFAASIQDYSDEDSQPTQATGNGKTFYGMEKMPFIREVYIQAGYEDKDIDDFDGDGDDSTGTDAWVMKSDSQAVAIEIGNPFDSPIDFASPNAPDVQLIVKGGALTSTYQLTGTIGARNDSDSTDIMIILSNAPALSAIDENGHGADLESDLVITQGDTQDAGAGNLKFSPDAEVSVELQIKTANGYKVYDRFSHTGFSLPEQVNHDAEQSKSPDAHGQASAARDGQFLRYLSNVGLTEIGRRLPDSSGYLDTLDKLGEDPKGTTDNTIADSFQIPLPNRPIYSVAELGWIFMLGFEDSATGDLPSRIDSTLRFLDFTAPVPDATSIGVPHASLLLADFETLSPMDDGIDNDQDGATDIGSDLDEHLIPGKMNINTVPVMVGTLATPMPEIITDVQPLFEAIHDYRKGNNRPAGVRTEQGIASIGELLVINPSGSGNTNQDMLRYGLDGVSQRATVQDLYPMPEDEAAGHVRIDSIDDAEELMARFQFLASVYDVRTDIVAAYIRVRGRNAIDNTVLIERRGVVIFDRSSVTDASGAIRILGAAEY